MRLAASLDLTAAEPLCQALRVRLDDATLAIDGSAVERISTPCLQVLAAAHAGAVARGTAFRLHAPSEALRQAIDELGLSAAIPVEG
ncbi:STAS domain-containing protein [Roseomonas sp. BU-1]|uniref:STAS domain-containing protein n=2 Tax=Falsiroseomonas selenitidurans TaxID=2716335 RepID=A0ABX1E644_9PROT|nr:STAS domain-containing protein [Falsiroseomonas selenitidurans]